ncbi:TRAP transporter permease [Lignipirellula cremea]|uniref:Sialic acid TRAP transporter permease protein SiaT n=1 Tax=Lignipirellula cremea TaxID=2528010 RepID=A0A518DSE0_9BACT|nr:TRAP transporter fused permease subunit [Lignipirellula cremea]QDU94749.1 Sialic acid TRAP transporter permease protein SiaT [Lignipirellula cremea]
MFDRTRQIVITVLSVTLCLFTLYSVNFSELQPLSALAVFVGIGLVLCYLIYPAHPRLKDNVGARSIDALLALAIGACCAYVVIQTEEQFSWLWMNGQSLGNRAGIETTTDFVVAAFGVLLVLEATRRSIGWIVPALSVAFMAHAWYCHASFQYGWPEMPAWLLPHPGHSIKDIVISSFCQSSGVFGPAADVMYKYVFLFVVFGAFLEMSGATQFIIDFAQKIFGHSPGGPAKVSVLGSGLMGSLSGSAVANAVTTGSFTIPMMRNAGFPAHIAGGITAAAASGGALVPPVMGAGAYMMLELITPTPTFLDIVKAALIPALLYYFSIFMIVHFYSGWLGIKVDNASIAKTANKKISAFEAIVFFGALGVLIVLLLLGFTPFRAVTGSLMVILVLATMRPGLKIEQGPRIMVLGAFALVSVLYWWFFTKPIPPEATAWKVAVENTLTATIIGMFGLLAFGLAHPAWRPEILKALVKSAKQGVSLVAASACVGIIIGIVTQTGIASEFSANIKAVVETNLFLALIGIMLCSLVLGMGVPSVVCYLLMATLMGSLLEEMGVYPLAAHLFIFYFGMMSMVTPPVALAGYAAASIAESPIMQTSVASFRFSLVGFTLPFMFIYQPALLLLGENRGDAVNPLTVAIAVFVACLGIIALAAALVGYLDLLFKASRLTWPARITLFLAAAMLLSPEFTVKDINIGVYVNIAAGLILLGVAAAVAYLPALEGPPPLEVAERHANKA